MDFHRDLRAHSCHCLRGTWGRALCSLDFALKCGWVVGKLRFWDPSLQAPKLTGTVRFYRVLLQSPSNLHLPCLSSLSPSLVQVSLWKWSHRVPQGQQLQISGWMAAVLCFQDFCFPSKSHPWLVGIGQMFRATMSFLLGSEASCPGITSLWSWSWSSGPGLSLEQAGRGCRRSLRIWGLFCHRKYRTAVQSF